MTKRKIEMTLPRCEHGYTLSDWEGTWLNPPCGCNFDNATDDNKKAMAVLKLREMTSEVFQKHRDSQHKY